MIRKQFTSLWNRIVRVTMKILNPIRSILQIRMNYETRVSKYFVYSSSYNYSESFIIYWLQIFRYTLETTRQSKTGIFLIQRLKRLKTDDFSKNSNKKASVLEFWEFFFWIRDHFIKVSSRLVISLLAIATSRIAQRLSNTRKWSLVYFRYFLNWLLNPLNSLLKE